MPSAETAIRDAAPTYSAQPAGSSHSGDAESRRCIAVRKADGTLTILNFRFGQDPRHHLLEDVTPTMANQAAALVKALEEARYRRAAARIAAVNGHRMAKVLAFDAQDAEQRYRERADVFAGRLDLRDSWGVVVIDGHAISRNPDRKGCLDVARLDGRRPCDACEGAGIRRGLGGGVVPCGLCGGTKVSPSPGYLPACLRPALAPPVDDVSWLDVPVPDAEPVDPALQRLADDFQLGGF